PVLARRIPSPASHARHQAKVQSDSMTQLRNLPRQPLINSRLRLLRRSGRIDVNLERDSPLTTRIRAKKPPSPLCVLSIRVCSRHSWAKSACSHFRVHLCSFVVSRKLG